MAQRLVSRSSDEAKGVGSELELEGNKQRA